MAGIDWQHGVVELAHGAGGRSMAQLIEELFIAEFADPEARGLEDQASLTLPGTAIAMSTDSFVISPLFFPGGDIGSLAVHGTVNDVAVSGATPLYLSAGFILEAGFKLAELKRIVQSMAAAARAAGVRIVTGDTKVVERGKGDGVFINTAGIGALPAGRRLSATLARPGDRVLISGSMGDHGVAIMAARAGLSFDTRIESDSAALNGLTAVMLAAAPGLRLMRDPTRGGLAAALNEIAQASGVGLRIREAAIPVQEEVRGACELLGLDPLYVANEGKLMAVVAAEDAPALLAAMRAHPLGREAAIIGEVVADPRHFVEMETVFGGRRIVDWMAGEPLPRIC